MKRVRMFISKDDMEGTTRGFQLSLTRVKKIKFQGLYPLEILSEETWTQ